MTDTPNTEEETEATLSEKIQHGAQELSETTIVKDTNDAIDRAEEFLDEHLHLHRHNDENKDDENKDDDTASGK